MASKSPGGRRTANVTVPLESHLVFQHLFRGVGGPVADRLSIACADGLVPFEWDIDPTAYSSADSFRPDYLASVILSKFDDEKSSAEKVAAAMAKFDLAEERCKQVNEFFLAPTGGSLTNDITVEAAIFTAQRKISRLLGALDLDEVSLGFGFGPGASTRLGRRQSDAWYKFSGKPEVTNNCAIFADAVFQHYPLWKLGVLLESEAGTTPFQVVRANRVVTVPKNAKIDRVIAIEPDLNLFVQKGFGAVIRNRLKKVGIDLNDQTANQNLARDGSIDGSLATLDLSMASDTVSRAIVRVLLPPDWLLALEQCRSEEGVLPSGRIIRYQKFSSMGNGFTFELESLIFWALCSSVADLSSETDRRVSVYGDDLIVPTSIAEPVIGLLKYCGFSTNRKKSFVSGPFRESCGKHYFRGVDVTPFYVRKQPKRISDVFLLHNNAMRWSARRYGGFLDGGFESGIETFCKSLKDSVPKCWRKPRIPDGYGDGAFIGSFDECTPSRVGRGYCGWRASVLVEPRLSTNRGGVPRLLKSLFGLERRGSGAVRVDELGTDATHCEELLGEGAGVQTDLRVNPLERKRSDSIDRLFKSLGFASRRLQRSGLGWFNHPDPSQRKRGRVLLLTRVADEPLSKRATVRKIVVRQWADLGPWI